MADGGYIKLYRRIQKSAVWEDEGVLKLWLTLLLRASRKPKKTLLRIGKEPCVVPLEAGQYIIRLRLLAADMRVSVNTLRRRLDVLRDLECIRIEPTAKFTKVTLTNWREYQATRNPVSDPVSKSDTPSNTPSNTGSDTHHKKVYTQEENSSCPKSTTSDPETSGNGRQHPEPSAQDQATARWMLDLILDLQPNRRPPDMAKWSRTIRLMRERDGRTDQAIRETFAAANRDDFWKTNILSPDTLREKYDNLRLKLKLDRPGRNGQSSQYKLLEPLE